MFSRLMFCGLIAAIGTIDAPSRASAQFPAGRSCPRTAAGQPSFLYGFDTNGALLCAPLTPGLEVCDGVDNNMNGQVDEFLYYCIGGRPAPNTDGRLCLFGYGDRNRTPSDGCEYRGAAEEAATRVLAFAQVSTSSMRLDGASPTQQVLSLRAGQTIALTFTVLSGDSYPIQDPVYANIAIPACPYATFSDDAYHKNLTITTSKDLTAGGDCQVTRGYAHPRTPQVVATLNFIVRVSP